MGDIAFRRIRGRIVPIKLSKEQKQKAQGAAISGAGVGVAVGGGSLYKRAVVKSADLANRAFKAASDSSIRGQLSFDDLAKIKNAQRTSEKLFRTANYFAKFSGAVRKASPIIGGALIAYGTSKSLMAGKKKKKNENAIAAVSALAGSAAAVGIPQAKKLFELGLQPRQEKFKFASNAAKSIFAKFLKSGL